MLFTPIDFGMLGDMTMPMLWRIWGTTTQGHQILLCDVVESMAVMTTPADMLDGSDGLAVPNTPATWRKLMAAVIEPPARKMKPAPIYFGRNSENYRRAA